jgi:uncharacterized protein (DUF1499 family)
MIHDVTTDPHDPPPFVALRDTRLACKNGMDYSGLDAAAHHQRYPDVTPLIFTQAPEKIFRNALGVVEKLGWVVAAASESEGRIEATATTRILRFKDDVVIRIRKEGSDTRLDIRSASRVGRSDLGANAKRLGTFLFELIITLKSNT